MMSLYHRYVHGRYEMTKIEFGAHASRGAKIPTEDGLETALRKRDGVALWAEMYKLIFCFGWNGVQTKVELRIGHPNQYRR